MVVAVDFDLLVVDVEGGTSLDVGVLSDVGYFDWDGEEVGLSGDVFF